MAFRELLTDGVKVRIRSVLAWAGIEIGAYAGSFAEHRTHLISESGVRTVWDVGAHIGQYAVQLRSHGYMGRVISIEPAEASFKELSRRAGADSAWIRLRVGLSWTRGGGRVERGGQRPKQFAAPDGRTTSDREFE